VDKISRAHWEMCFENRFLRDHATAFHEFFCAVMERRYPDDFQRVVPWGQIGDLKNDGYLASRQLLFQCYGPKVMDATDAIAKINADYDGAVTNWGQHFIDWIFVHNQREGLPPTVSKRLLDITAGNRPHPARPWGFNELRDEAMGLSDDNLGALFGDAPTVRAMLHLGFDDLRPLIEVLSRRQPPVSPSVHPVPAEKLTANMFSRAVLDLIEGGFTRTSLVAEYFRKHHDPTHQDFIATWFREQYLALRGTGASPDQVFDGLRDAVGGVGPADAAHESGVLAIVAFFFETCDIFEPHARKDDAATN
jgi:hypothetical protein